MLPMTWAVLAAAAIAAAGCAGGSSSSSSDKPVGDMNRSEAEACA
jgi:hypothetical protein